MKRSVKEIEVAADWEKDECPRRIGVLSAIPSRGKEIFSFMYDDEWLKRESTNAIDPALQLYTGAQLALPHQGNFGVFLDSSPDRWGRVLMQRREALLARDEGRTPTKLLESDYLLGVYDEYRMGAIRIRIDPMGPFLDNNESHATPPWTTLRELEQASLGIERDGAESNPKFKQWLSILIAPGASLGGARPKANVVDEKGHLCIAKFPSIRDQVDQGAWEYVLHVLAIRAGITTAPAVLMKFSGTDRTFITQRFDRDIDGRRQHFASAMTLLQRSDGEDATGGVSYLEIAELIKKIGSHPVEDLEQLWRRIVFSICVSNVDDHLRNHGFLLTSSGWKLSPAYDLNPSEHGNGLKLNISEDDNSQSLSLTRETAKYYGLTKYSADNILQEVVFACRAWRDVAASINISSSEQRHMEPAFYAADEKN